MTPAGFPHSDIHGSQPAFGYPWLFVDRYVLLRLPVPRHPPCALLSLTCQYLAVLSFSIMLESLFFGFSFSVTHLAVQCVTVLFAFLRNNRLFLGFTFFRFFFIQFSRFRFGFVRFISAQCCGEMPRRQPWWAQVDSNHRPHAYQACALTT